MLPSIDRPQGDQVDLTPAMMDTMSIKGRNRLPSSLNLIHLARRVDSATSARILSFENCLTLQRIDLIPRASGAFRRHAAMLPVNMNEVGRCFYLVVLPSLGRHDHKGV